MTATANIVVSVFRRRGGAGPRTDVFDALDSELRSRILREAGFEHDEQPILASVPTEDDWVALTGSRVVSRSGSELWALRYEDVAGVEADTSSLLRGRTKGDLEYIRLTTSTGLLRVVRVERGLPYFGVLNALKAACRVRSHSR